MRFFYLIILLYCGNVVFGQDSLASEIETARSFPEAIYNLQLPFLNNGFFHNYRYNHFEELFPSERLKSLGIKTIIIQEPDKDKIPTISINDANIITYNLNENGKVNSVLNDFFSNRYYTWNDDELIEEKVVSSDFFEVLDSTTFTYEYSEEEIHVTVSSTQDWNEEKFRIYTLDDKGRIIRFLIFKDAEMMATEYVEEEGIYYIEEYIEEEIEEDFDLFLKMEIDYGIASDSAVINIDVNDKKGINKIYFQENGKPFLSEWTFDTSMQFSNKYIEEVIYAEVNNEMKIIKSVNTQFFYDFNNYNFELPSENLIDLDSLTLEQNGLKDIPTPSKKQKTQKFIYNDNGLITKIIISVKGKELELEVFYLKN